MGEEEKSSSSGSGLRGRLPPVRPPPEEEEMEEGEIRPCGDGGGYYDSGSETEDDDDRYVFQSRREEEEEGVNPASKRRRLVDILAETRGALPLPSPTPSSSGSEGTISDDGIAAGAAAADAPVARVAFPCHICSKEFGSRKAVHGHMRVHQAEKEPSLHLALGWTSTGKRGANGSARAVTIAFAPMEQAVDDDDGDARAIVLAPAAQPQPQPMVVAEAANPPPNQVADDNHRLPASAPYPAARRRARRQRDARLGGPYKCSYPGCKEEYRTHQGLGGHVAGHINREKQAAAAAAAQGGSGGGLGGGAKPEGNHRCKMCGKEFPTGVALGGHMRKHYDPKKKKHAGLVLTLSVAPPTHAPAPAIAGAALPPAEGKADVDEHEAEQVPMAPVSPPAEVRGNIVRIFGVDIEKPADEEEQEGGSDV